MADVLAVLHDSSAAGFRTVYIGGGTPAICGLSPVLAALSPQAVPLPLAMKDALCAGTLRSMILALAKRRPGV